MQEIAIVIIDKIENYRQYSSINEKLLEAFVYLNTIDFKAVQPGKYEIMNDEIFAIVSAYETKNKEEDLWEAHKKYIDIQYIVKGIERIGYCNLDRFKVTQEYDHNLDVVLGQAEGDLIVLHEGDFMILFPQDAHKPGNSDNRKSKVKKVVVKVRI